jgi:Caspase domain/Glucodextranase, domain B
MNSNYIFMYKYFIISLLGCAPFWVQAQIQTIQYRTTADLQTGKSTLAPSADITAPVITVTEPATDSRGLGVSERLTEQVTLGGLVKDASGIQSFTLNGNALSVQSNGRFQTTVTLVEGANRFYLQATDSKGNVADKTVVLQYSSQKPVLPPPVAEKRVALIIGNATYKLKGTLKNAANDAHLMERTLKDLGFTVFKYTNCDQKQLKQAIRDFGSQLTAETVALVFYAGHGIEVNRKNYLIPVDAELKKEADTDLECVAMESIIDQMASANTQKNVLILDACRDNPFARSWGRTTGNRTIGSLKSTFDVTIFYATTPGNTASDGSGENGLFTSCLVPNLSKKNLDLFEIITNTKEEVVKLSRGTQKPYLEGTPFRFIFKR